MTPYKNLIIYNLKWSVGILLVFVFLIFSSSCKKRNEQNQQVPYVPLVPDILLYSSDPEFFPLNVSSGYLYRNGASRGVLIYRASIFSDNNDNGFRAFDRHCPYDTNNPDGIISVDSTNSFVGKCKSCGSEFILFNGAVNQGPAQFPLRTMRIVDWDGNRLFIRH
jgi:nitrite reductase/ring-hydroxylating ferredoxin subunit